jgi:hypothetical protein
VRVLLACYREEALTVPGRWVSWCLAPAVYMLGEHQDFKATTDMEKGRKRRKRRMMRTRI